jgi:phosphatidylinositol alpha-1,6-mannosyltransferase
MPLRLPYSMSGRKVLMLTSTIPRWPHDSTPRFILDLAVNLSKLGWQINVIAPGCRGARAVEDLEGVTIHRFSYMAPPSLQTLCYDGGIMPNVRANPARTALVPPFFAAAIIATRRLIRRFKPALVHAHWIVPMGLVATLAIPRSIPLVITVHGSDALDLRGSILARLKSRVLARADIVTCNGSKTEQAVALLAPPGKHIVRIPMGTEQPEPGTTHGIALPENRFTVLFAGRLFSGKGLDDLLEALVAFNTKERPFLLVVGTGPEERRLKRHALDLGIEADVAFLGGLEHARLLALMRDVKVVVVPTRSTELIEGQGLVIAEAMLAETPVIATFGGGAEDQVRDGKTGLLVPPANPAAIQTALLKLMEHPVWARKVGEAARIYARENLTWQVSARAFAALYQQSVLPCHSRERFYGK